MRTTAPATLGQPPRILVVHNRYQQRGGEDAVVEAEVALLRNNGHDVALYERSNDEVVGMSRAGLALQAVWSRTSQYELAELITGHRPNLVHVHNTLPLISPSVYWAAQAAGLPVVQTLHNFRLMCPQALLLREGQVCEDCVGKVPWRAVQHRCYRGSALQSAVVASTLQVHRWLGTWRHKVDRYIALNSFCREKFIEGGLPADRISVKPNFVDMPSHPRVSQRRGLLFVGRLSHEKGVATLARSMRNAPSGLLLRVVGSGPDAHLLQGMDNVTTLGALQPEEVFDEMRQATALVVPSIWYENYPRTIVEAFACGTPVIASRIGALASLVEDRVTGLHFNAGDASDLRNKIAWVHAHPTAAAKLGQNARRYYEHQLTGAANYRQLVQIYDLATNRAVRTRDKSTDIYP